MSPTPYFKLEIYAPEESVDEILAALVNTHAGEIGKYDHCATLIPVQGFWRPLEGASQRSGSRVSCSAAARSSWRCSAARSTCWKPYRRCVTFTRTRNRSSTSSPWPTGATTARSDHPLLPLRHSP